MLVLVWAAGHTLLDRVASTRWKDTLWVGIFPANADGTPMAQSYIDSLSEQQFKGIEDFFEREAHRYGKEVWRPVHVALYPQLKQLPPQLDRGAGRFATAWWSLRMRWYAWRAADVAGRAPPRIRIFLLYHDPATLRTLPDSHGLQKGLMGVAHAFAVSSMAGSNDIVITHELLHTLGATDKYDPNTNAPLFPSGFADPARSPLYPQTLAEIMAGTRALSAATFKMPATLDAVVVGPATAAEIRWLQR